VKYFPIIPIRLAFPLLVLGLVVFSFWYVFNRGGDQNWDLLNYHYFTGYSLLNWRYVTDISAAGLQSFQSPVSNLLAYLTLSAFDFPLSSWIIASIQLTAVPLVMLIARQVGAGLGYQERNWSEITALLLCFLAPLWWSELGTTFADASIGPVTLLGLYLCGNFVSGVDKRRHNILFAGLCFGIAVGVKLTNATFSVAIVLSMFGVALFRRRPAELLKLSWLLVGMVIGFTFLAWWNVYLYRNWYNPLFPFYNAIFESPFFDSYNWRDLRWHFGSLKEFIDFIYEAAFVTGKTGEIPFADGRFLIISILIPLAIIFRRPSISGSTFIVFFLTFTTISFLLWSMLFAYQRYLIPVELLFGLVIWILCRQIVAKENLILPLIIIILGISFVQLKIPDWGHRTSTSNERNAFDLDVPAGFAQSPARYLVVGAPVSYILPFLHPDSRFFGLGVSRQIDEHIEVAVKNDTALPLRILAKEADALNFWKILARYGVNPEHSSLDCRHFRSAVDWYVVCEIEPENAAMPSKPSNSSTKIDFNFVGVDRLLPDQVIGVAGLSNREQWGRWSDGDEILIVIGKCLSAKKIKFSVTGQAFGPNIGKPVGLFIGSGHADIIFGESGSTQDVYIDPGEGCHNEFRFTIPNKTSPAQLGISADARQLGLKLSAMSYEFN
jgi:hypothetical protein